MMSSTHEGDPFLQVQQDVLSQLQSTRSLFASYLRIRSLSTNPSSPELVSARADLESAISFLTEDLADLVASVRAVESDPRAFGLDSSEVTRRNRLVKEVGGEVKDMREELVKVSVNGPGSARAASRSGREGGMPESSSLANADGDTTDGLDDFAAEFEHQQQLHMMQEQDEQLDGVFQTVGNLRRQADVMGRELEEQREMLEVTDERAERVGSRLQIGMKTLEYVIRNNEDRWSRYCIAVLITVLVILLVLLLIL